MHIDDSDMRALGELSGSLHGVAQSLRDDAVAAKTRAAKAKATASAARFERLNEALVRVVKKIREHDGFGPRAPSVN